LISQIKNEGTISAIAVCSDTGWVLMNDFSMKNGVYIKRVWTNEKRNRINLRHRAFWNH